VFTAETVAAYLVGAQFQGLTNSYMTDEERANIDVNSREHFNRVWGSKIQIIGWSFYACILWSLKFCVTAFYGRLTYVLVLFLLRRLLLTLSQLWINSPQDWCNARIHYPRSHIRSRRSHASIIMPTLSPLLAGYAKPWAHLPTDKVASIRTGGRYS
jgi:hypothetical protein